MTRPMSEEERQYALRAAEAVVDDADNGRTIWTSIAKTEALARALLSTSAAVRGMREASLDAVPTKDLERVIEQVLMDVCELPDRNSPDDHPEMMLVTGEELDTILKRHLGLEDRALAALSSKGEG